MYVTAGNPYYMGTPLYERDMPTYVRYDVKATYDIGRFQGALFATPQPHKFASDIAYGTAGGLVVTTVPQASGGASLRYFFWRGARRRGKRRAAAPLRGWHATHHRRHVP